MPSEPGGVRAPLQVPKEFRRGDNRDNDSAVGEAAELLAYMGDAVGTGLDGARILDIGCGVKFTQAILRDDLPVARYVGVDVYREMLDWLTAAVDDDRFRFVHMDSHNEMYNPDGAPLGPDSEVPVGDEVFDIVCGFSLFTHLAPHDYVHMLRLMRRYVASQGRLFFSLFVNETTAGGHGLIDAFVAGLAAGIEQAGDAPEVPDFVDFTPAKPLLHAVYSRAHAFELMEGTGWRPVELRDPLPDIQHHFICEPV